VEEEDLFVCVGESESPRMIHEEDVGVRFHRRRRENKAPLTAALAWLDLKVAAAVEGLAGELLEEAPVQALRQPRRSK